LTPYDVDEFDVEFRGKGPAKVSIAKEYRTINQWLAWAETIAIAQEDVSNVLEPPSLTKDEEVSTERLDPAIATANIRAYRSQPVGADRATRQHTLLELIWWTGARQAALRALDLEDIDFEAGTIEFVHRPDTGPPLKQAHNPERIVGLQEPVVDVLRDYRDHVRDPTKRDGHGRTPFLTTERGRMSSNTVYRYATLGSVPCHGGPCPHDRDPATCEFLAPRRASQCPSARGPHAIRTGAISNLLNSGWHLDDVADRVNTGPPRLKKHYDFPSVEEQYRERRADLVDQLRLDDDDPAEGDHHA
jgi:integrase